MQRNNILSPPSKPDGGSADRPSIGHRLFSSRLTGIVRCPLFRATRLRLPSHERAVVLPARRGGPFEHCGHPTLPRRPSQCFCGLNQRPHPRWPRPPPSCSHRLHGRHPAASGPDASAAARRHGFLLFTPTACAPFLRPSLRLSIWRRVNLRTPPNTSPRCLSTVPRLRCQPSSSADSARSRRDGSARRNGSTCASQRSGRR